MKEIILTKNAKVRAAQRGTTEAKISWALKNSDYTKLTITDVNVAVKSLRDSVLRIFFKEFPEKLIVLSVVNKIIL